MARVSGDIPNLINGVSQQAAAMRQPTQCEVQTNFYSTVLAGLKKRPPTEQVAKLSSPATGRIFHIIHRDENEKYIVVIANTGIQVFDFDGNQKIVHAPNNTWYVNVPNPQEDLRCLTVADYTFILNRRMKTAMASSPVSSVRPKEAIINILAGNYDRTYQININGNLVASYATPDGSSNAVITAGVDAGLRPSQCVATTQIAKRLYDQLVTNLGNNGAPWGIGIHQNALHVVNYSADFSIAVQDGVNGNAMKVAKGTVQKFSDLPNYGPDGFVVEVGNSNNNDYDNYWVRADKGGTNNNSAIRWRETVKPGTRLSIDPATMPHKLVRNADGSFTFSPINWDQRKCGDDQTVSPDPSFIGRNIEDVFFHANRLGFLSDENVVLSRAGSYFDMFRTSATTVLDDDPIDVAASHVKVSLLKHALPFQEGLLLFSSETQFRLSGNDVLTPKTVSIKPLTEYSCSLRSRPIQIGSMAFFASDSGRYGEYTTIFEYTHDKRAERIEAAEVTAHVPGYIPAGVTKLVGSADEGMVIALTKNKLGSLFVYRYYWANQDKVQSSWSEWTFKDATVLDAQFIFSDLYLILSRPDGVFLERMRLDTAVKDSGLSYVVALDRRITLTNGNYNAETNTTTFTLPYPSAGAMGVVVASTKGQPPGYEPRLISTTGNTIVLAGNLSSAIMFFGIPFESRFRFSPFFYRQASQNGNAMVRVDGRLQIQQVVIVFDQASVFRVEVTDVNNNLSVHKFNGNTVGGTPPTTGLEIERGRIAVPLQSRNDRVTVELVNDTWMPSAFTSASWRGIWAPRALQI